MTPYDITTYPLDRAIEAQKAAEAARRAREQNIRLKFDARVLPILAPFVPRNDLRHYLNGIRVEHAVDKDKGIYILATDGHTMAAFYDEDGQIAGDEGRGVIMRLPREMVAAAKLKRKDKVRVVAKGPRVSLAQDFGDEHTRREVYVMPGEPYIDHRWIDWRRVLPSFDQLLPVITGQFNGDYIARATKGRKIKLWQEPSQDPHSVKVLAVQDHNEPNLLMLVMPMRDDTDKSKLRAVLDAKNTQVKQSG